MGERTFTREELEQLSAGNYNGYCMKPGPEGSAIREFFTVKHLAMSHLTALDRIEQLERELQEAEEAVLKYNECMDHVGSVIYDWRHARSELRDHPAVRRALDRKGEG